MGSVRDPFDRAGPGAPGPAGWEGSRVSGAAPGSTRRPLGRLEACASSPSLPLPLRSSR